MEKVINCPLCNGGKLKINVSSGFDIVTSGHLKDLPCIVYCKTCNRRVKYTLVKKEDK